MSNWVQHIIPELCDWWITSPLWPSDCHYSQVSKPTPPSPEHKLFFLSKERQSLFPLSSAIFTKSLLFKNCPAPLPIHNKFLQKYLKTLLAFWNTLLLKQTRIIFINWDCPIFILEFFQNREWPFLAIHNAITLQILTNNCTDCMHDAGDIIRVSTSL